VAVMVELLTVCPEIVPFVALQLPIFALPVSVPVSNKVPFEQTEAEVGEAVTPLKLLTVILPLLELEGSALILPHGLTAKTFN